ncbi:predicted protein, partial [Postia placenta Mad-698-R]
MGAIEKWAGRSTTRHLYGPCRWGDEDRMGVSFSTYRVVGEGRDEISREMAIKRPSGQSMEKHRLNVVVQSSSRTTLRIATTARWRRTGTGPGKRPGTGLGKARAPMAGMETMTSDGILHLIRHGKNHHTVRAQDEPAYQAASHQPPSASHQPKQQQRDVPHTAAQPTQQQQQTPHKGASKFKEHAETIVQEEREAKGKMPTYKGLENYKLLDKMGDGAFSNVYKAIDTRTGQKVYHANPFSHHDLVKVVRKYELSASQ